MTTSKPTEIREFWLGYPDGKTLEVLNSSDIKGLKRLDGSFKVIEYHAVEQLNDERLKLLTAIDDFNLDIEARDIEIAALKSKLSQFEGMTFSENQELSKLRKQVKDYEQALKNWIDFENESIEKDGPYVGKKINKTILQATEVLKKWGGV